MPHQLPNLPYDYAALEPHIDAQTMQIHHSKHHQAYVNGLNAAEESVRAAIEKADAKGAVKATAALNFHGGGHANHSLFWNIMAPKSEGDPQGELSAAIHDAFGSLANFKTVLEVQSAAIQGSGWGWLCWDPTMKCVVFTTTSNQDNPTKTGLSPLLGLDVWEHAYYLKYQNRRPDYIKAWWNVVAWDKVAQNFQQARG